jgi:hypothetical protein
MTQVISENDFKTQFGAIAISLDSSEFIQKNDEAALKLALLHIPSIQPRLVDQLDFSSSNLGVDESFANKVKSHIWTVGTDSRAVSGFHSALDSSLLIVTQKQWPSSGLIVELDSQPSQSNSLIEDFDWMMEEDDYLASDNYDFDDDDGLGPR